MALATAGGMSDSVLYLFFSSKRSVGTHSRSGTQHFSHCGNSFVGPVISQTLDSYNQQKAVLVSVAAAEDAKPPQMQCTQRTSQSEGCACVSQRFSSLPHLMTEGNLTEHSSTLTSLSEVSSDKSVSSPLTPGCCSQHRPLNIVMEENIRMRQAINDMLLTLTRWMRQNNEQAEQVKSLLGTLQESDRQRNDVLNELEALKLQLKQADRDKERAKQMILKLQEENWGLRKARSIVLISRGPNANPADNCSIRPSACSSHVSRFDSPD